MRVRAPAIKTAGARAALSRHIQSIAHTIRRLKLAFDGLSVISSLQPFQPVSSSFLTDSGFSLPPLVSAVRAAHYGSV